MAVTAGTTYVASYLHQYRALRGDPQGLASAVTNGPLTALAGGGVYAYGSANTFPANTYHNNNYWVDVVYSPVGGCHAAGGDDGPPGSGSTGNAVSVAPSATFSQPVTPSTVSFTVKDSGGNSVAGSVGFNAADTVATFTPVELAGGEHDVYGDGVGGAECLRHADERAVLVELQHRRGGPVPVQHLANGPPTGSSESNDPNAQTLGVQFQASSSGFVTGVRFYKEPDNTGAHTGSLWSSTGSCWRPGRSPGRPPRGGRSWTSPARWR